MSLKSSYILLLIIAGVLSFDLTLEEVINEQKYLLELVLVTAIVILSYNYILGCEKNQKIVKNFLKENLDLFLENFYHIGLRLEETPDLDLNIDQLVNNPDILEKDTANFFRIYFTGRENLKYCILSMATKRRQDFIVSIVYDLFWPEKDRIYLECALSDSSKKGLLYLIKNKKVKSCISEYEDLSSLCNRYSVNGLNKNKISVFAEVNETIEYLLDKRVKETLNECGDLIETLELSDCFKNELHQGNNLKFTINLGKCNKADYQRVQELLKMMFYIVDKLTTYKPSKKTLEKFEKNRKMIEAKKQKEKVAESGKNFREEKMKNMTPMEKRRYEEKILKRQKSKMNRFKVMRK